MLKSGRLDFPHVYRQQCCASHFKILSTPKENGYDLHHKTMIKGSVTIYYVLTMKLLQ